MSETASAMRVIDDAVRAAHASTTAKPAFGRLRKVLSKGIVNVSTVVSGMDIETMVLGAPYNLVDYFCPSADIAIITSNCALDASYREKIERFRATSPDCVLVLWLVDHHHVFDAMLSLCEHFDFAVPCHVTSIDYLQTAYATLTAPVPCSCEQWTPAIMSRLFSANILQPRSDLLYGGFRAYPTMARNAFIAELEALPGSAVALRACDMPESEHAYFSLTNEERFKDWMSYKASVVVCVKTDIPMRLFDALASGQIPIVPWDIVGLDLVISPDDQARLPILRYTRYEPEHVADVHREAVRRFNLGGTAGALRRHRFAFANHLSINRMQTILALLENMVVLSCE